jgi:thioredoxin reductase (NADPH)
MVAGGGDTAVTDALYLSKICKKVYVVHRRATFRATDILVKKMYDTENIEVITDSQIVETIGEPITSIKIKNLKTNEVSEIEINGLFVAVGTLPNTTLIKGQINLDDNGYIITDSHMKTNIDGVYAAGDIRVTPLRQVITACADGAIAAESAIV